MVDCYIYLIYLLILYPSSRVRVSELQVKSAQLFVGLYFDTDPSPDPTSGSGNNIV